MARDPEDLVKDQDQDQAMTEKNNPFAGEGQTQSAAAQPSSIDLGLGTMSDVNVSGDGIKFTGDGHYLVAVDDIKTFIAKPGSPVGGGNRVIAWEFVVLEAYETPDETMKPGAARSMTINSGNTFGYGPTIKKFTACLMGIEDLDRPMPDGAANAWINNKSATKSAVIELRTLGKVSQNQGNPYIIANFVRVVPDDELTETQAALVPGGTRTSQKLPKPSEML